MEKTVFKELLIEFYPQYFKQVTGSKTYKLKITEKKDLQFDRFTEYVFKKVKPETLGEDFIQRYLQFAFGNVTGRTNPWGRVNAFPLSWIVAKTVLDKFFKAKGYERYYRTKKLRAQGHSTFLVKSKKQISEDLLQKVNQFVSNTKTWEEAEKLKFFNTEKGRVWCIDFTTLYHPKSDNCQSCKFKSSCQNLLKINFGGLYKLRMDERNI